MAPGSPPPLPSRRAATAETASQAEGSHSAESSEPRDQALALQPPPVIEGEWDRRRREAAFWLFTAVPSGLLSLVIHLLVLIGFGVCMLAVHYGGEAISIEVVHSDPTEEELIDEQALEDLLAGEVVIESDRESVFWDSQALDDGDLLGDVDGSALTDVAAPWPAFNGPEAPSTLFTTGARGGRSHSDGLAGRGRRRQAALAYGATAESENAVELALEWLVRHQRQDGSWSFDHRAGSHQCKPCLCRNGGRPGAENGATAMALLPLLGAGHTHLEGRYRRQVAAGLRFLIYRQKRNGSFMDSGNMYSHGLAALALGEALAMTRQEYLRGATAVTPQSSTPAGDRHAADLQTSDAAPAITLEELTDAAQRAIVFIETAQDPRGGGWRYQPQQPGDTSVVGWQMMALKSGYLAGLDVKPQTVKNAEKFLNSAALDQIGSHYGYMAAGAKSNQPPKGRVGATTAIGLLCRMYTGWERDREGITKGVTHLSRNARPDQGLYFYYYATQAMHHYGGVPWEEWNRWMRDYLVETQSRRGSTRGSWSLTGSHDSGRLYCTSMAAMTLEIYYRYSPIYGDQAVTTEFAGE